MKSTCFPAFFLAAGLAACGEKPTPPPKPPAPKVEASITTPATGVATTPPVMAPGTTKK
jgi:hypothetical protein